MRCGTVRMLAPPNSNTFETAALALQLLRLAACLLSAQAKERDHLAGWLAAWAGTRSQL